MQLVAYEIFRVCGTKLDSNPSFKVLRYLCLTPTKQKTNWYLNSYTNFIIQCIYKYFKYKLLIKIIRTATFYFKFGNPGQCSSSFPGVSYLVSFFNITISTWLYFSKIMRWCLLTLTFSNLFCEFSYLVKTIYNLVF